MNNKNLLAFNLIIATAILVTAAIIFSTGLAFFGYRECWKDSEVSSEQSAIHAAPLPSNTTTVIPAAQPPTSSETAVTFGSVTLVIPPSVASGASGSEVPRRDSDDAAGWQKTPGHTQIMLGDYYVLEVNSTSRKFTSIRRRNMLNWCPLHSKASGV